ncbi:hypothetical protein P0Y43_13025 [Pseudomonas entomophila]|uniref:hypothetical protein n=1 Tax=Pseudomonas entomophila TaxID=312306 RepID=UPI0023D7FA40|nr:hypothetical protein [Pseudomonas entomophila]MDF0731635.1 hypothetical protein [Pseudomonas entomophila]
MFANVRLLVLQDDLIHTAQQLDELCRGLEGHARFLGHSLYRADASAMSERANELRDSARQMRHIAQTMTP